MQWTRFGARWRAAGAAGALWGAVVGVCAAQPLSVSQPAPEAAVAQALAPSCAWQWALLAGAARQADVRKLGLAVSWPHARPLWQGAHSQWLLRHELVLAGWHVPQARQLLEVGYSPVLRWQRGDFFVQMSIGVRLLSHTRVSPAHRLSTAFQFSDMLGLGWQWGAQGQSSLALHYQHLSNLGIKRPNPGMDFVLLQYQHRF